LFGNNWQIEMGAFGNFNISAHQITTCPLRFSEPVSHNEA
jgi:hypothetical protein